MEPSLNSTTRLELNAALTRLTESWDEDAAQMVVNAFHSLPCAGKKVTVKRTTKDNAAARGHTNEAGDVTIHDSETKETVTGESEEDVVRIGHYKVKRRDGEENSCLIEWYHFWAADPTTMNLEKVPAPIFGIEYNEESLEPVALIRWDFFEETGASIPLRIRLDRAIMSLRCLFSGESYEESYVFYVSDPVVLFGKSNFKAAQ